ncbi:14728_t:CDS:1, partial [Cetraspora pellucida]
NLSYYTDEDTEKDKVAYKHFLPTSTAITQYLLRNMLDRIEDKVKRKEKEQKEQMEVKDDEEQKEQMEVKDDENQISDN